MLLVNSTNITEASLSKITKRKICKTGHWKTLLITASAALHCRKVLRYILHQLAEISLLVRSSFDPTVEVPTA